MSELPCFLPCFRCQYIEENLCQSRKSVHNQLSIAIKIHNWVVNARIFHNNLFIKSNHLPKVRTFKSCQRTENNSPGFLGLNTCKYDYHTFSLLQVGRVTVCFSFQLYGENFCKIFLIAITSYKLVRCSLRNFMSTAAVCRIGYWYFKVWRAKKEANRLRRQICRVSVVRSFFKFKLAENS